MIKKQGFVALLDILGFAGRVALAGLDKYIAWPEESTPKLGRSMRGIQTHIWEDRTNAFFLKLSCRLVGTKKNENISIMSKSFWLFSGKIFG